jgi:signal transduction histidine kinase
MVTVHLEDHGGHGLRLSVIDAGPPLPDATLAALRVRLLPSPGPAEMRSGTRGLGLHIVAEIARALRADLDLDRGPEGSGLAVTVTLPVS